MWCGLRTAKPSPAAYSVITSMDTNIIFSPSTMDELKYEKVEDLKVKAKDAKEKVLWSVNQFLKSVITTTGIWSAGWKLPA